MNTLLKPLHPTGAVLIVLLVSTLAAPAQETVNLDATKDNTIFSEGDESNGQGSYVFVGATNSGAIRRALVSFDLSSIPAGSTIQAVSLHLNMNKTISGAVNINVHRLTNDWGEGNSNSPGEEGTGTAASQGDATWNHTFFATQQWSSPGGDFDGVPSASLSVSGISNYTWSSAGLVANVQSWIDNPASNFGWILIGPDSSGTTKRFDSRHNANGPVLEVTYAAGNGGQTEWAGYTVNADGRSVNTDTWIGWIDISQDPWIFNYTLNKYIYLPEENVDPSGGWIFLPRQ